MNIIYEDSDVLIVNKPAGVLTQSNRSFDKDLTSEVMTYRRKKGETAYAAVINRLDRPVGGLVLFAKNKKTAADLSNMLQKQTFNKMYYAVVEGRPSDDKGVFEDYLIKDALNNISYVTDKDTPDSRYAKLEYERVKTAKDDDGRELSLLRIHLITGRHHQIRVQLSSRNMPIVGDAKYGSEGRIIDNRPVAGRNKIALCAYSLTVNGKTYEVDVPWEIKNK